MPAKTLMIGLDGADDRLIRAMADRGELPHFARLMTRSAAFEIENDPGQGNVQFWTSAAIGAGPGHHGHYFYMQFDPKTYDIVLDHDLDLPEITPLWRALDQEGYRTAVVDWYEMPVAPLNNGVVIHRWFAHEPLTRTVCHPPEIRDTLARYAESDPIAEGFASRPREGAEAMKEFFDRTLSRIPIKSSFYREQLKTGQWDLFIACLSEAHNIGHYYMEVEDESHALHDPAVAAAVPKPLQQCYRALDTAIGEIVAAAGPQARVFLLGGPRMEKFISANGAFEEIARRADVGYAAPLTGAETARNTYHAMPDSLRNLLRPAARWARRRLAGNAYKNRRFFAVPHNDNSGAIRINLKGREKFGTVSPGPEYDALVQEIADSVGSFINPATGRSIVGRVIDASRYLDGPYRDMLPDVFIEWDRTDTNGNFTRLVSERFGEVTVPPHARTGDHGPVGFFWAPGDYRGPAPRRPQHVTAPVLQSVRAAPAN